MTIATLNCRLSDMTIVTLCCSLADMSKEEEAVSCLEQALELEPHMEEAHVTLHRLQSILSRVSAHYQGCLKYSQTYMLCFFLFL